MKIVLTRVKFAKIADLSVIFCASVVGGNISLRYLPVSFNQAVGAMTSFFTMVFVYLMTMKQEGWLTYVTLIPVVTGFIIAIGELRKGLEDGHDLGALGVVLFNGLGPNTCNPFTPFSCPEAGKTYQIRVSNVVQQKYIDLDIHVGQSYSFLVTMDQDASSDYYIVANPRFVNSSSGGGAVGIATLHYTDSQGPTSEISGSTYNKDDVVARCITQYYLFTLIAVLAVFDTPLPDCCISLDPYTVKECCIYALDYLTSEPTYSGIVEPVTYAAQVI
ncbi:hypothetical protein RDABS01_014312 [Bienertia sinuspersici]